MRHPEKRPTKTLSGQPLPKRFVDTNDGKSTLNHPDRNIDCLLTFDIREKPDVGKESSWQRRETQNCTAKRMEVLKKMHAAGLQMTQSLSMDQKQWVIRVSAQPETLEKEAEKMQLHTKMKNTLEENDQGLLNGHAPFKQALKTKFEMSTADQFKSVERQRIILYMIDKALGGNGKDLKQVYLNQQEHNFHLFPTHDPKDKADLNEMWVYAFWDDQPLDKVRDYFGEDIALYFAFLGYYTFWLAPLALLGTMTWALQLVYGFDVVVLPFYTVASSLWAMFFLVFWRRYQAGLQVKWDTVNFEKDEADRMEFHDDPGTHLRVNQVTGEEEDHFSAQQRALRYIQTFPIMFLCLVGVIAAASLVVFFNYWAVHSSMLGRSGALMAGVLNYLVITITNAAFTRVARRMTAWENHQTETGFQDNFIIKVFIFQFVNSYSAVAYLAFFAGRVNILGLDVKCSNNGCLQDIHDLVFATMLLQIIVGNTMEVTTPIIRYKIKERQERLERENPPDIQATENTSLLSKVVAPFGHDDIQTITEDTFEYNLPHFMSNHEKESNMEVYTSTFYDYNELVIQFGYVTMFALALPMGSLLCWVNNFIEIRSDAFRLCNVYQRPFYKGAQDIGSWYDILKVTMLLGIIVNGVMTIFTSNIFVVHGWVTPNEDGVLKAVIIVFCFEHLLLAISMIVADFVEEQPNALKDEIWRTNEKRRALFMTQDDEDASNEILRRWEEKAEMIDESDIANMEDTAIYQWRKQPQFGVGHLKYSKLPDTTVNGQPALWPEEKEHLNRKRAAQSAELLKYRLY